MLVTESRASHESQGESKVQPVRTIVIVRHGRESGARDSYEAGYQEPKGSGLNAFPPKYLTPEGEVQILRVGKMLRDRFNIQPDMIMTSQRGRAIDSGLILSKVFRDVDGLMGISVTKALGDKSSIPDFMKFLEAREKPRNPEHESTSLICVTHKPVIASLGRICDSFNFNLSDDDLDTLDDPDNGCAFILSAPASDWKEFNIRTVNRLEIVRPGLNQA
jgi:phosphohistidine phosphatase SixA